MIPLPGICQPKCVWQSDLTLPVAMFHHYYPFYLHWSQIYVPAPLYLTVCIWQTVFHCYNHIHQSLLLCLILSTLLFLQAHIHHCLAIHLFVYPIVYPAMFLVAVYPPLSQYTKHFHTLLPLHLHLFIYELLKCCRVCVSLHPCATAGWGRYHSPISKQHACISRWGSARHLQKTLKTMTVG